jgi:hypothetical protein
MITYCLGNFSPSRTAHELVRSGSVGCRAVAVTTRMRFDARRRVVLLPDALRNALATTRCHCRTHWHFSPRLLAPLPAPTAFSLNGLFADAANAFTRSPQNLGIV